MGYYPSGLGKPKPPRPLGEGVPSKTFQGPLDMRGESATFQGPSTYSFMNNLNRQTRDANSQVVEADSQRMMKNIAIQNANRMGMFNQNVAALNSAIPKRREVQIGAPQYSFLDQIQMQNQPGYQAPSTPNPDAGYQASPMSTDPRMIEYYGNGGRLVPQTIGNSNILPRTRTQVTRTGDRSVRAIGEAPAPATTPEFVRAGENGAPDSINWGAVNASREARGQEAAQKRAQRLMQRGLLRQLAQFAKTGKSPVMPGGQPAAEGATPAVDAEGNPIPVEPPKTQAQGALEALVGPQVPQDQQLDAETLDRNFMLGIPWLLRQEGKVWNDWINEWDQYTDQGTIDFWNWMTGSGKGGKKKAPTKKASEPQVVQPEPQNPYGITNDSWYGMP